MRYIDHQPGGSAEIMKLADMPRPTLRDGEVLIEVAYAGVNRPDVAQRAGSYPPPADASPVLGLEVAGRIAELGPGVTEWQVGDEVCALTPGGGYAEFCAVPAPHCLPIPKGLSLLEAASLPENFFTVWTNVFDRAHLKAGEHFLVHGGSSGIGLTAIQLAKAFGAEVYTTVGNAEKAEHCRKTGADHVYNYREQDWAAEIWQATSKRGLDVILDMVGGDYIMKNLRLLATDGRLVNIAFLNGGQISDFDGRLILGRRLTYTGSTLRPQSIASKAAIARSLREHVWPLIEAGKVKPQIHQTFPLEQAVDAHRLMESSRHIGKIMLEL